MKKCPSCEKTFDDSMRFCQVCGTPLVDDVPAFDPYATIVAQPPSRREPVAILVEPDPVPEIPVFETAPEPVEIAPEPVEMVLEPVEVAPEPVEIELEPVAVAPEPMEIAPEPVEADPVIHQTVGSEPISEPHEILDLPQDPLKTMFVSEDEMQAALAGLTAKTDEAAIIEIPEVEGLSAPEPPSFIAADIPEPVIESVPPPSPFSVPETFEPEPVAETPAYQKPEAPSFDEAATMIQPSFNIPAAPPSFEPDPPPSYSTPEPEAQPIPESPFNPPPSPFEEPSAAASPVRFDSPPAVSFDPPPVNFDSPPAVSFDPPPVSFDPPVAAPIAEWSPPPAPVPSWENKEIGTNTPFQPPQAGAAGPSSVLAIISVVVGVIGLFMVPLTLLSLLCGAVPLLLGVGAAITGFLARSRAISSPEEYGGKGLATGGIILGIVDILGMIAAALILVLVIGGILAAGSLTR